MKFCIEPLEKALERAIFSCGDADLDDWFRSRAGQDSRRNIARVFVAVEPELGVIGFYSLNAFTLTIEDLPEEIARKLPRYESIPAALIGRLATDLRVRSQGVGKILLADAIRRVLSTLEKIAVFAIVVDAKNDDAAGFYRAFGFTPFPNRPHRLFLLTTTAAASIEKALG